MHVLVFPNGEPAPGDGQLLGTFRNKLGKAAGSHWWGKDSAEVLGLH